MEFTYNFMRTSIFTKAERHLLEGHLTKKKNDKEDVQKLLQKIKKHKSLFEDVFLYLQVKKTMSDNETSE